MPIIGTHGAGKTTLVARLAADHVFTLVADAAGSTRRPVAMVSDRLTIIGDYSTEPYSGIDSGRFAGRVAEILGWVTEHARAGRHVVLEGMLAVSLVPRFIALAQAGTPVTVLALWPSIDECVSGVAARKAARVGGHKNSGKPIERRVIETKHAAVRVAIARLRDNHITVVSGSRAQILEAALKAVAS